MAIEGNVIVELPIEALIAVTDEGETYVIPAHHLQQFRHQQLENMDVQNAIKKINGAGLIAAAYRKGAVIMGDM
jgi:hypothetical protein